MIIELRSTVVQESDSNKRQPFLQRCMSKRSSNTNSQTLNISRNAGSPIVLKKPPLKKTFVHAIENVEQTRSVTSYRQMEPEQFKQKIDITSNFVFNNYKITDLTYSLIKSKLNITVLTVFFFVQIIIRYFSICCLIYLMVDATNQLFWEWILIWMFNNFLYFVCIVKISIKFPQTQSENILKDSFNSLEESQHIQYFQVIDSKKLRTSIIRGLVPPQFSFLYIKDMRTRQRHLHIYVMINYIYSSIEAIIYYPFIIIYTVLVYKQYLNQAYGWAFYISYATILLSEVMFVILSIILTIYGCKKKGYLLQPKIS